MDKSKFFWLHLKKCAGQSFRKSFTPPYVQTDRSHAGSLPFIALPKNEWNDAINNYRIPLGEYDFRRMLFVKSFLYDESEFKSIYKFTIVRNPYDRAVSFWKYLTKYPNASLKVLSNPHKRKMKNSFEYFLEALPEYWELRKNRHMATHTAPIWPDITDKDDSLLLDDVFKLEEIDQAIKKICEKLSLENTNFESINRNRKNADYAKHYNPKTIKLVEDMYGKDISMLNYSFQK